MTTKKDAQYIIALEGESYEEAVNKLQVELSPGGEFADFVVSTLSHAIHPTSFAHFLTVVVVNPATVATKKI